MPSPDTSFPVYRNTNAVFRIYHGAKTDQFRAFQHIEQILQ